MIVPLHEQIDEIEREIALRALVYPNFVARGRMTEAEAAHHTARMQAVLATLHWLDDHADICRALGREAVALRNDPRLRAVVDTWPDATVVAVRPIEDTS